MCCVLFCFFEGEIKAWGRMGAVSCAVLWKGRSKLGEEWAQCLVLFCGGEVKAGRRMSAVSCAVLWKGRSKLGEE